jgi:hypothetical protein
MISRAQQILIKRAQAQARIGDEEYRDAVALVSGIADCRSSKDKRLTDGHVDKLLSYFETIYWKQVDAGEPLKDHFKPIAVFRKRGYWASKNQKGNTSRDRYMDASKQTEAADLEAQLYALGFGLSYVQAIHRRIQPFTQAAYVAALKRTLDAKKRAANCPF